MSVIMRIFFGSAVCIGLSYSATAQQYGDLLIEALSASANGECPTSIMSNMLASTCQSQMPGLGQALQQAGEINGVQFMGIDQSPNGPVEVYRVDFENRDMTWAINTGSDGKIMVLWSSGQ